MAIRFAHALETLTGYGKLLHGEAVAIGMNCAARLAEQLGRVDASLVERQRKLLRSLDLPLQLPKLDREKIVAAMMHDKKMQHGRLRLVLPSRLGQVELVDDVSMADIRTALEPMRQVA